MLPLAAGIYFYRIIELHINIRGSMDCLKYVSQCKNISHLP